MMDGIRAFVFGHFQAVFIVAGLGSAVVIAFLLGLIGPKRK